MANFSVKGHMSLCHIIFGFFKQPFKNVRTILTHGLYKNRWGGFGLWVVVCRTLPYLDSNLGKDSTLRIHFFYFHILLPCGEPEVGTKSLVFIYNFCCTCFLLCHQTCQFFADHTLPFNTFVLQFLPSYTAFLYSPMRLCF